MLPQLATETFISQIFWVVLGFFCVYGLMHFFAVPKLKRILEDRQGYVDELVNSAKLFEEESKKIEKESEELLSETRKKILSEETKFVEKIENASMEEKKKIANDILKRTEEEIVLLDADTDQVFKEVSADLDVLLDLASDKVRRH